MAGTDFLTATAISFGFTTDTSGLDPAGTIKHYYRLELLDAVDYVWFDFVGADIAGPNIDLDLYDSTQTRISSTNTGGTYDSASFYHYDTDLPAGTYYIELTLIGANPVGSYTFYTSARINGVDQFVTPTIEFMEGGADTLEFLFSDRIQNMIDPIPHVSEIITNPVMVTGMQNGKMVLDDPVELYDRGMLIPGGTHITGPMLGNPPVSTHLNPATKFKLNGTVKNEGAAMANCVVRLYDRKSGQMMEQTRSDANGFWNFTAVLYESSKYYVIAFDDFDAPVLQAVVHDYLTPVT